METKYYICSWELKHEPCEHGLKNGCGHAELHQHKPSCDKTGCGHKKTYPLECIPQSTADIVALRLLHGTKLFPIQMKGERK